MLTRTAALLALLVIACGAASGEREKVSLTFSYGVFRPASGATRDRFGESWTRIGVKTFEAAKPTHWRLIGEGCSYELDGDLTKARLISLTAGVERGLREKQSAQQPYITVRAGPFYGTLDEKATGSRQSHVGLNVNAACGIVFSRRFYVEARYDYFSRFAGSNFSGASLSAGIRLFDVRL